MQNPSHSLRCVCIAVFLFLLPVVTGAGELEQGVNAYHNGDYATALAYWKPLARSGNRDAQVFLGWLYSHGLGVSRDSSRAAEWYRRAAEQGDPNAQYELGLFYELGLGVDADYPEAEYWYGLAVDQGYCPGELSASGRLEPD